ncbi:hypothetical protein P7C73_g3762, partial [Tremellales sp. Uapishka_1]
MWSSTDGDSSGRRSTTLRLRFTNTDQRRKVSSLQASTRSHHYKTPRSRSISRSSSSPSPEPTTFSPTTASPSGRDKRRSFTATRSPNGTNIRPLRDAGPGPSRLPHSVTPNGDGLGMVEVTTSSAGWGKSGTEEDEENHFVSFGGEETEVEGKRGNGTRMGNGDENGERSEALNGGRNSPPVFVPQPARASSSSRRPLPQNHHPLPATYTLLPLRIGLPTTTVLDRKGKARERDWSILVTRKRCEDGLLLSGVLWGIVILVKKWDERALAGEMSLLVLLSIFYTYVRYRSTTLPHPDTPTPPSSSPRPHSPPMIHGNMWLNHVRERSARGSGNHGLSGIMTRNAELAYRATIAGGSHNGVSGIGARGCIWGTEERDYRDCLDDGALFALLLAPLVASAMLHVSLSQLASEPLSAISPGWMIESPLVLPSTPIRRINTSSPVVVTDAIRALSALVTSRKNLVQLFTLLSFVLLVQLLYSRRRELWLYKQASIGPSFPFAPNPMERDGSDFTRPSPIAVPNHYWLRRGEWRRTGSVVGFAFVVTAGCVVVKIVTAYIGRGVWSDMSPSDIIIATLFYQFSLYVCVRLARKGFTLGELGVVCHAATALFMETVNLTRMKIRILRTPYIKTYRLPTPLLTFQLALIPGSLLAGFLLSPLLVLSRHLAQKPAHRLRFPHEKPVHRRLLALGFYAGAALVCGGIVGFWTKWCLGWRDPWIWVVCWMVEGKRVWTRPVLISYWGALAMISVAGWNRQLSRARRHRRYVVPGGKADSAQNPSSTGSDTTRLSGVATQMMDAADQRMPTLSVNARRKFFHALAVVMFVPGIAVDPAFTHLSFSVAFAAFNFAEYVRYFALWPFGASVHIFLNEFLDHKDSGTAILSHFYLLAGCASPLWLEGPCEILNYYGILSLGIGDALASIIGRRIGHIRWTPSSGKTVEGSIAFLASVLVSSGLLWMSGAVADFNITPYIIATTLSSLLEAFSAQNDNLILPVFGWALGSLLGV